MSEKIPKAAKIAAVRGRDSHSPKQKYTLELYVSGMTPRSLVAIKSIQRICREYLRDRCHLKVIDIYQHPALAKTEQIVALPTLIKRMPLPLHRLIGDMSQTDHVLLGLDLKL